ncbi:hypothetical protein Vadar_001922 [Vaccinium darrowii]|uniref:Uncharacterized protein n=1 Tax=Vaccinium darrowii TaxID=229202 RepID=A0ACB7YS71_9ERIC|nr:hypothetical protein Vadar_001922 [Vaccinium darrowii]
MERSRRSVDCIERPRHASLSGFFHHHHNHQCLLHPASSTAPSPLPKPQPNPNTIESLSTALYKERNLRTLIDKFKSSCDNDRFRTKIGIYVSTVGRLASAKKFLWIKEILEHQKHYTHDISKDVLLRALFLSLVSTDMKIVPLVHV